MLTHGLNESSRDTAWLDVPHPFIVNGFRNPDSSVTDGYVHFGWWGDVGR